MKDAHIGYLETMIPRNSVKKPFNLFLLLCLMCIAAVRVSLHDRLGWKGLWNMLTFC
jgi:hypothetical protein